MRFLTSNDKQLSNLVKGLITTAVDSQNVILTTTLDGGVHAQSIGEHRPIISFKCLADEESVAAIAKAFINAETLKIVDDKHIRSFVQVEAPVAERFSGKYKDGMYIVNVRGRTQKVEVI